MSSEESIRDTPRKVRSNPIRESYRAYRSAINPRQAETRQLRRLIDLQSQGVKIYRNVSFQRVDASELRIDNSRVGVVGLVVDREGDGYITQLNVSRSDTWHVAANLPFRDVHLKEAILELVQACIGYDHALPELLAFRVSDSLGDRSNGGSMDIACLLAIIDATNDLSCELFSRAAAVVSPAEAGELVKSDSAKEKLIAFERELGRGSLLIRHPNQPEAAAFDSNFDAVWQVSSFSELARHLDDEGLLDKFLIEHSLQSKDKLAIAQHAGYLLADESRYQTCQQFIRRLKNCIDLSTPRSIQVELLRVEQDLHRHMGAFDKALELEAKAQDITSGNELASYDELLAAETRYAAAMFDAHDFAGAARTLEPWNEKLRGDPRLCSVENRSYMLNTLARAWVILKHDSWDNLLRQSVDLQTKVDSSWVPRTTNYLIHGLLRAGRTDQALDAINSLEGQLVDKDSSRYLLHLKAEHDRQVGKTWSDDIIKQLNVDPSHHATGFLLQCLARQAERPVDSRLALFRQAEQVFMANVAPESGLNVKRFLAGCCRVAIAIHEEAGDRFPSACDDLLAFINQPELPQFRARYQACIENCANRGTHEELEELFRLIPFF